MRAASNLKLTIQKSLLLACCIFSAHAANHASAAEPAELLKDFRNTQLYMHTDQRCILLSIYVADTAELRRQGLMNIRSMPAHEGMLFIMPKPTQVTMWMKNTFISLDMVFLDRNSRVVGIAERTEPLSEKIVSPDQAVDFVLELNGGMAEQLGIRRGALLKTFTAR